MKTTKDPALAELKLELTGFIDHCQQTDADATAIPAADPRRPTAKMRRPAAARRFAAALALALAAPLAGCKTIPDGWEETSYTECSNYVIGSYSGTGCTTYTKTDGGQEEPEASEGGRTMKAAELWAAVVRHYWQVVYILSAFLIGGAVSVEIAPYLSRWSVKREASR